MNSVLNATAALFSTKQPGQNSDIKYKIAKFDPGAQNANRKNLANRTLLSMCPNLVEILTGLGRVFVPFFFIGSCEAESSI